MANRQGNSGNSSSLYFLGSKITADCDCSHEIKRCLLLGRKDMTNLNSVLKSRDITLSKKVGWHHGLDEHQLEVGNGQGSLTCCSAQGDRVRSVQFNCSAVSDSLQPHELQHTRPPCLSPTPRVYSNSCPLSRWCLPAVSSSVVPFSSCPQSLPASGSFPMNQLFATGGQSIGVSASASVLPMNTQDWSPLQWTGWISLQSKGLSRDFSDTTVQKHQFFSTQLSSQSNSHIHTWPLEIPWPDTTEQLNWIWFLLYLSIMLDAICYVTDYLEDTLCFLKPNFIFLQVITFLYTVIVKGLWFLLQVELCFSSNWSVGVLINTCCWWFAQLYLTLTPWTTVHQASLSFTMS